MRPNFPFLLAASNVILKPGGLLKWKKRLLKGESLWLQLKEVMKIVRLTSLLPDMSRLSLPNPSSSQTSPRLLLLAQIKLSFPCKSTFVALAWIFSYTFLIFPSIWKTSSIVSIHKMGNPFDSPASLRHITLTFCVSKLFEHIILSRLLFFLVSNSILLSALDQIIYLSQSISDGFNKPKPGSRTIFFTIDFSKAFDSLWHPALFHKPIWAGLSP